MPPVKLQSGSMPIVQLQSASMPTVKSAGQGKNIQTSTFNPWREGLKVEQAMRAFASRVTDSDHQQLLEELCKQVETLLGPQATNASNGVYNAVRLYRFLLINKLDLQDTIAMVVVNSNARQEHEMDEKRARIVKENLGLEDFPYARECFGVEYLTLSSTEVPLFAQGETHPHRASRGLTRRENEKVSAVKPISWQGERWRSCRLPLFWQCI